MIIIVDVVLTLIIFLGTILISSAFLSIAFVEGAADSRAGGAILARRCFAITITSSFFLFCIPILSLLGVYSNDFAKQALSFTLSVAVAWNGVILPALLCRLALAHAFSSSAAPIVSRRRRNGRCGQPAEVGASFLQRITPTCCCTCFSCCFRFQGLFYWSVSVLLVGGVWTSIVLSTASFTASSPVSSSSSPFSASLLKSASRRDDGGDDAPSFQPQEPGGAIASSSSSSSSSRVASSPYACRFTPNDVHVLKRSGVLNDGPISGTSSKKKSASNNQQLPLEESQQQQQQEQKPNEAPEKKKSGVEDRSNVDDKVDSSAQQQRNQGLSSLDTELILRALQASACSSLRDCVLARLALIGACCVAALSGFAAVQTPIGNLFPYMRRNSVGDAERHLQRLQQRLQQVMRRWGAVSQEGSKLTNQLQQCLAQLAASNPQHNHSGVAVSGGGNQQQKAINGGGSFLMKMFSSVVSGAGGGGGGAVSYSSSALLGGSDSGEAARLRIQKRLSELQFEIAGYRYLATNLATAIDQAAATLHVASMGKSRGGKIRALFGIGLSIFGAAKTINLLLSVTVRRLSGEDAATVILRTAVNALGMQDLIDVATVASRISLVLNMLLVSNSIRGFLILMFRLTQSRKGPPPPSSSSSVSSSPSPSSSSSPTSAVASSNNDDDNSGEMEGDGAQEDDDDDDDDDVDTRLGLLMFDEDNSDGGGMRTKWWYALIVGGPSVDRCPGTLSLVSFSLFMGLHFLGAFVLLRLGFPAKSRAIIIDAVGTVPFVPCHAVHDVSFLVSVAATAIVLWILRRMDEAERDADDVSADDDLFGV